MKEIFLQSKKYPDLIALVDDEEYEILNTYSWRPQYNNDTKTYYALAGRNPTTLMHRLILEAKQGEYVDHRDHNTLNNQKYNLRLCSNAQNSSNREMKKEKSSIYKGVSFIERGRRQWKAQIKVGGKHIYLGCFSLEKDAAEAYDKAAKQYFGEFALVNSYDT